MYRILKNFRATPRITRVPTSAALLGRATESKFPEFNEGQQNATLAGNNQKGKAKMRRLGDDSKRKRAAPRLHESHKVIRRKNPMVTARNERGTVTRKS